MGFLKHCISSSWIQFHDQLKWAGYVERMSEELLAKIANVRRLEYGRHIKGKKGNGLVLCT